MLRLLVIADSSLGFSQSAGAFTVNNPGNAAPDCEITFPGAGDTVSNQSTIAWSAADADGNALTISIDFSADNGASWEQLASSIANTGTYAWNTAAEANTQLGLVRVRCSDGITVTEKISRPFTVKNTRYNFYPLVRHPSGAGDGSIAAVRVDAPTSAFSPYRLTFNDSGVTGTTYSVDNLTRNERVVTNVKIANGIEGPLFDGIRLIITDYPVPQPGIDSTRWIKGASTLEASVSLPDINLGSEVLKGVPYPADYVITISDHVTDTSGTFLDTQASPMKFSVWNRTESRKAEVIYNDNDNDAALSRNDELYLIEKNSSGVKQLTWQIVFPGNDRWTRPVAGDQMLIKILKPFTSRDVIELVPSACAVSNPAGVPGQCRLEQNFPNPFNPATQIRFTLWHRELVRLRVYDMLGREVATLVDAVTEPGTYSVEWNAKQMSSGMYFYRIDAGAFSRTMKLVLVR
jgi:hypothetical protein